MSSKEAANVALEGGDEEVSALLASLRADPTKARQVLDDLSKDSRRDVRGWAAWAASSVLGKDALPLLLKLARDRDSDVSDVALADLLDREPAAATRLIEGIRKKVRSSDPDDSRFAMWSLARLGDRASADTIRPVLKRSEFPFLQRVAEVVLLVLEGKSAEILRRLREHDHENTSNLAYAALIAGADEGVRTVEDCSKNAPDPGCRHYCEWHLGKHRLRTQKQTAPDR